MKKVLFALVAVIICLSCGQARDYITNDINALPKIAQQFLSENFSSKVSHIKVDKELGYTKDYEVVLTDGTEIDFNRDGSWDKVEMPRGVKLPSSITPKGISDYVGKNFPGQIIESIDKERRSYEVELSNGLELIFDLSGNFLRYDD